MRSIALLFLTLPAAAAPLPQAAPRLTLRVEGIFGQPTTLLGARGGAGFGAGWRLTDQLSVIADASQRALPGGGSTSVAAGLQATLDITPIAPCLELAMVEFTNSKALGYSLAMRTGAGADWQLSRWLALGLMVRTYAAFDAEDGTLTGLEAALRLVFTLGAK